ncbi:MAG: hypothetical protein M3R17_14630 [Bacteroidota bacterium]|nr:hypothetical protein [Bacteroidota bacterium]
MPRIFFIFLLLSGNLLTAYAQTNAEKLEKAVKIYNATRAFIAEKNTETITTSDIDKMERDRVEADVLLNEVKENGTPDEVKTARYFAANFNYEIGYAYSLIGKNRDAYAVFNKIKAEYEFFSNAANFPFTYKFDSKNYQISFENFSPTLSEYYAGMAEISYNLSKYDEAIDWGKKTLAYSYSDSWQRYVALNNILKAKEKNSEWDKEMLDYGLQQINICLRLDTADLRVIKEFNYPTALLGAEKIESTLTRKPALATGEYYRGTAAPLLAKAKKYDKALLFYKAALQGGFADNNKSYLFDAATFALDNESRNIAILALDLLYDKNTSSFSCEEWDRLAGLYAKAENSERKNTCTNKAEDCRKKLKKEQKQRNSGNLGFGIYGGVYPLALATRFNRYRDYGGVFGIVLGQIAIEGSYKLINRNFIITDDLMWKQINPVDPYYWEGYRAHVAMKFYPKSYRGAERFHLGPMIEIVDRTYEPVWSNVINTSTGALIAENKKFYPHEKSYNLFFNFGKQQMEKGFYYDMFMGFGVAYSKFDAGEEYADGQSTFSDVLLQNRKDIRFSPVMRMGITLGLGWVKK